MRAIRWKIFIKQLTSLALPCLMLLGLVQNSFLVETSIPSYTMGHEGNKVDQMLSSFGLQAANESDELSFEDTWTFQSSLGHKRRIDFIFASPCLEVVKGQAVDSISLGSDHRAVLAELRFRSGDPRPRRRKRIVRGWAPYGDESVYHSRLDHAVQESPPHSLSDLEHVVREVANECGSGPKRARNDKFWGDAEFQSLLEQRRGCSDPEVRKVLSKQIRKQARKEIRRCRNDRAEQILKEFKDLDQLDRLRFLPARNKQQASSADASPQQFADFLSDIFASDWVHDAGVNSMTEYLQRCQQRGLEGVPEFLMDELKYALRKMCCRKCQDEYGLVVEMFKCASDTVLRLVLTMFNNILRTGTVDPTWHDTLFVMLPKKGDRSKPGNWRPIAILRTTYKIFSKLVYERLRGHLEAKQPPDQVGFRKQHSINDAFAVLENVCGKSLEWNIPCWVASLDLKKAFDRIEYPALFEALRVQGVEQSFIALLAMLYNHQTGRVQGSQNFGINRGVKQGDVISPMLFSAGLELALSRWKLSLGNRGLDVGGVSGERLTNVRYADDLIVYATSCSELCNMIESLCVELRRVGLHFNAAKTKILTTEDRAGPAYVEIGDDMVEILFGSDTHVYLGRKVPGSLRQRADVELSHRLQAAWSKFHERRSILTDRQISIRRRLKLFDSVVTPTVLFGLPTLALTTRQKEQLDVLQRRMLRLIVGWVRLDDEDWNVTMRRMNDRVDRALSLYPVRSWRERLAHLQYNFAGQLGQKPESWAHRVSSWSPPSTYPGAGRGRGRPACRWDDHLQKYSIAKFGEPWYVAARDRRKWRAQAEGYTQDF